MLDPAQSQNDCEENVVRVFSDRSRTPINPDRNIHYRGTISGNSARQLKLDAQIDSDAQHALIQACGQRGLLRLDYHIPSEQQPELEIGVTLRSANSDRAMQELFERYVAADAVTYNFRKITERAPCSFLFVEELAPPRWRLTENVDLVKIGPRLYQQREFRSVTLRQSGMANHRIDALALALASQRTPTVLRVELTPFVLDAAALCAIDNGLGSLSALQESGVSQDEYWRLETYILQLENWRRYGGGVKRRLSVLTSSKLDADQCQLLRTLVYGQPKEGVSEELAEVDLAAAYTVADRLPRLFPAPNIHKAMGAIAHEADTSNTDADAVTIGQTATGDRVAISRDDLAQHTFIIGSTGVGKSTLLANMILQDVKAGYPVLVVDPHGDLFSDIRNLLPAKKKRRAMIADVSELGNPFGLNILGQAGTATAIERNFISNQLIDIFKKTLYRDCPEGFGPVFELYFRNALMLLMSARNPSVTLADFDRIFIDNVFRGELVRQCSDPVISRFWRDIADKVTNTDYSLKSIAPYIVSKLSQFTGNPLIRPIITSKNSTIDFQRLARYRKVCLVNLSRGVAGEASASLIGALVLTRLFAFALRRAALPKTERQPIRVYLDEFHTYATDALGQMLAEGRKFGIECVLANQSLSQVDGSRYRSDIGDSILANIGTILAFRVGPKDAAQLAPWFEPELSKVELSRLHNREVAARLLRNGQPSPGFKFTTDEFHLS